MDIHIQVALAPVEYKPFFDNEWASAVTQLSKGNKKLDGLVLNLIMNWRSAIYAASAPYFMVDGLTQFHDSFFKAANLEKSKITLVPLLLERLVGGIDQVVNDANVMSAISTKAQKISEDLVRTYRENPIRLPLDDVWRDYLANHSFQMMIWGGQRTCFVAIYCAFEEFLSSAVGLGRGKHGYRKPYHEEEFVKHIRDTFGDRMVPLVWTQDTILNSRLARNCLAHAGGKISAKLKSREHRFVVEDDRLQIMPKDLREQMDAMKTAVTELVKVLAQIGK